MIGSCIEHLPFLKAAFVAATYHIIPIYLSTLIVRSAFPRGLHDEVYFTFPLFCTLIAGERQARALYVVV